MIHDCFSIFVEMKFTESLTRFSRRKTCPVRIGPVTVGGGYHVAVQSMTDTDTNDIEATVAQAGRLYDAGCRIVRMTVQGMPEAAVMRLEKMGTSQGVVVETATLF